MVSIHEIAARLQRDLVQRTSNQIEFSVPATRSIVK